LESNSKFENVSRQKKQSQSMSPLNFLHTLPEWESATSSCG
jgi:hypothetical protein